MGFGPATGPTLKNALCHIRALVGRMINNGVRFYEAFRCSRWTLVQSGAPKRNNGRLEAVRLPISAGPP